MFEQIQSGSLDWQSIYNFPFHSLPLRDYHDSSRESGDPRDLSADSLKSDQVTNSGYWARLW